MVGAMRLGAWLRPGEGIGWLAVGTMPNSLYRMPVVYIFLACVFCYSLFFPFSLSFLKKNQILPSFCPADHVSDWQPRIVLGVVEARSVDVKKTTDFSLNNNSIKKSSMDQPGKSANPARGQLYRENEYFPVLVHA